MEKTMKVEENQTRMGHRWEVDIPLDLASLNSNRVWEAKILDLSLKGIRVGSLKIPLAGEEIKLTINIPGEFSEINSLGKVVWTKRTGVVPSCGISFTKIRDVDRGRVLSYIDNNFGDQLRKKVWWQDSE